MADPEKPPSFLTVPNRPAPYRPPSAWELLFGSADRPQPPVAPPLGALRPAAEKTREIVTGPVADFARGAAPGFGANWDYEPPKPPYAQKPPDTMAAMLGELYGSLPPFKAFGLGAKALGAGSKVLGAAGPVSSLIGGRPLIHKTWNLFTHFNPLATRFNLGAEHAKGIFPHAIGMAGSEEASNLFEQALRTRNPQRYADPARRLELELANQNTLDLVDPANFTKRDFEQLFPLLSGGDSVTNEYLLGRWPGATPEEMQAAKPDALTTLWRQGDIPRIQRRLANLFGHQYWDEPFQAGFDVLRYPDAIPPGLPNAGQAMPGGTFFVRNPGLIYEYGTGRSMGRVEDEVRAINPAWWLGDQHLRFEQTRPSITTSGEPHTYPFAFPQTPMHDWLRVSGMDPLAGMVGYMTDRDARVQRFLQRGLGGDAAKLEPRPLPWQP
jgi:hypothetical protein